MTDDPIPPGAVHLTLACNVCGGAIYTHHDPDAPAWVVAMLARSIACAGCLPRANGEAMARRAADRLEVRCQQWETLCPHEFRKPLDWTRCSVELHAKVTAWQFGARGLVLSGRTGLCKTRFACVVLGREFAAGRSCVFVTHADFRREVSYLAHVDAEAMRRYLGLLMRADVVLCDDLGGGIATPAGDEAFEMLLAKRARDGKPMLATCNAPDKLAQKFVSDRGEAIVRRLWENCEHVRC